MEHVRRWAATGLLPLIIGGLYAYADAERRIGQANRDSHRMAAIPLKVRLAPVDPGDDPTAADSAAAADAATPVVTSGGAWDAGEVLP